MEYDFWTMRESPFHQLSDFQCIFLFAFGEVKIICAFVTFSADPNKENTVADFKLLPIGSISLTSFFKG